MAQEHKIKEEVENSLGYNEYIEENRTCPNCGGILVKNLSFQHCEVILCVDCSYHYYNYD